MHGRNGTIGADRPGRDPAHHVTPAAARVKRGGDQAEILRHFEDGVERSAQALGVKVFTRCAGETRNWREKPASSKCSALPDTCVSYATLATMSGRTLGVVEHAPVVDLGGCERGHRGGGGDVLFGVLDRAGDRPMLVGVIDNPELPRPSPYQARQIVGILTEADENIARNLRDAHPVGRHQRPGLAAQHFPFSLLHIGPEMAHAQGAAVAGDINAGWLVAVEVPLDIAGERHALGGVSVMVRVTREFAALERNSSILPATVLLKGTPAKEVATPLPISVDRQTVEKSMKPPGSEIRAADVKGERRRYLLFFGNNNRARGRLGIR